jgi:tetratricopeptide (TPR) repeat protein
MIALVWILTARDRSGGDAATVAANTAAPFAGGQGAQGPMQSGSAVDPSLGTPPELTGTPREQADRLFNRIMTERENGDTAKARFFLPMGIMAYEQAGDLEPDGLYHLAILQSSAGRPQDAIKTAQRILAIDPDHLLALGAAAEAAEESGAGADAAKYYQHFYQVYDTEKKKTLAEYIDHARVIPQYYEAAKRFLKK